ncbi:tryptophan-rich sensory protein [Nakamurella flavida]|uniref:Tryptophan-rich sensory protein n=1 Tax=Nakamurella flavida TaxID=363630 RepID=A0A938YID8_9ACTN|nr:TspO/MBR family protein [Nakamurella flavida]MBM9475674.1 tryptophan-rich sensory protein [Nakamurella flavida]MDP9778049.1 tryptophan-rich sensory protein [Nakamurella flavida]
MKLTTVAATGAAAVGTAVAGGLAVDPDGPYYRNLIKPSWQPAPTVFPIVWTPLYVDIAVTSAVAADALAAQGRHDERSALLRALAVNLGLNTGWSWLFFRVSRPWFAAAECAALAVSTADLVRRVGAADRRAGWALLPYPLWCTFATALTVALARRNPVRVIEGGPVRRLAQRVRRA